MKMTFEQILELKKAGMSDDAIVAICNGNVTEGNNRKTTKTAKPKKATGAKAPSTNGDFDRAKYEETARKLGCYNDQYGKVVATVENGKVIRTAKKNRELVYAEMAK